VTIPPLNAPERIDGDGIYLRRFSLSDIDAVCATAADPESFRGFSVPTDGNRDRYEEANELDQLEEVANSAGHVLHTWLEIANFVRQSVTRTEDQRQREAAMWRGKPAYADDVRGLIEDALKEPKG